MAPAAENTPSSGRPRQRRTRLLLIAGAVVCGLLAAALTFAFTTAGGTKASTPIISIYGDGLPETLTAGKDYTATFRFTLGENWPGPDPANGLVAAAHAVILNPATPDQANQICSHRYLSTDPRDIALTCPFTAPRAAGPVTVQLHIGSASGTRNDERIIQNYPHTIRTAS